MDKSDLNSYWLGPDGQVWKILSFCEFPTVTFVRIDDPTIARGGAVGSPLVREFTRLVPEQK